MRTTGPTARRRNHAWLQMRNRLRRSEQLARRQQQDDTSEDNSDSLDSLDSLDSSDDGITTPPGPTLRQSLGATKVRPSLAASASARVEAVGAGRLARRQQGDTSDGGGFSDNDSVNSLDSLDSLNSLNSSDNGNDAGPVPASRPTRVPTRVQPSLAASASARARIGRLSRRQQQDDASDDGFTSDNESLDSLDSSDSLDSLDSSNDGNNPQPTQTTSPASVAVKVRPSIAASVSARVRTEKWIRDLHVPRLAPGVTLAADDVDAAKEPEDKREEPEEPEEPEDPESALDSASDGFESDGDVSGDEEDPAEESTTPPPAATTPPGEASPPPPAITSTSGSPGITSTTTEPIVAPSASTGSTSLDGLVTSLVGTSLASPTSSASPTVPVTDATQSQDGQVIPPIPQADERGKEGINIGNAPSNKLDKGAVAGIVIGVLAFVGILVGAALLWRKHRRDRGLPFFSQARLRLRDDDDAPPPPAVTGPLPGRLGGPNAAKTNTQIMDDLMKAAYAADNGKNDMAGAYAPPAEPKLPPQQFQKQQQQQQSHQQQQPYQEQRHQEVNVYMDEKAYMALAGPPTPGSTMKPVMQWLEGVKTPTQPNGPEIPPTPAMPHNSATMPSGGTRGLQQPKPAYYGRETMTTETTNTTARWFG
ncbi:hypothetical protein MYCTH_2297305 [Thermothelomyces thermophilus ATCC 42464]|uniref:Uncharacterized protein n=1 Tax=Thermothelomyces thermophilus (strain ATCC 42464 / BCRC 31852 / DSM 1799) TaxID=573729 RepID=G2Q553_THET4|nr:uncharacterized protein MYCTH_2297305 [Thermothelomyces thermophilus ATCC 42464]AEO54591.1 hypothetical protein MYCTH_2297305 [Thermothelomyces thermophilus ATCC 42464]